MADNFDLRKFLTENKLTKNTQLLKEESDISGYWVMYGGLNKGIKEFIKMFPSEEEAQQALEDAPTTYGQHVLRGYWGILPVQEWLASGGEIGPNQIGHPDRVVPKRLSPEELKAIRQLDFDAEMEREGVEKDTVNEASYKVSKNSKEAQHLKKGDIIGSGDEVVSVSAGAKTPKGKVEVTLKTKDGKTKLSIWGKTTKIGVKEKETVKENTMTQRDKYLTRLVENALGLTNNDEDQEFDPGHDIEQAQHNIERQYENHQNADPNVPNDSTDMAIGMMKNGLPEGDEMADETVIPEYHNIDELMKSIDEGTNQVAEEHKINKMKKIAEALRKKVKNLEEGEHAAHIDQKAVKQFGKDIAALEKTAAKLQAAFDKKFNKKEKAAPKKEKEAVSLAEGFDLRNFLVENKLTTNSRMLKEDVDQEKTYLEVKNSSGHHFDVYGLVQTSVEGLREEHEIDEDNEFEYIYEDEETGRIEVGVDEEESYDYYEYGRNKQIIDRILEIEKLMEDGKMDRKDGLDEEDDLLSKLH